MKAKGLAEALVEDVIRERIAVSGPPDGSAPVKSPARWAAVGDGRLWVPGSLLTRLPDRIEEESLSLRMARHRAVELVALERRDGVPEETARVELLVSEELEHAAVQVVRAGAGNSVHRRARVTAQFRAVVAGLQADLFERVGIRKNRGRVEKGILVIGAIQRVVVGIGRMPLMVQVFSDCPPAGSGNGLATAY
jgi:hypothetical protein